MLEDVLILDHRSDTTLYAGKVSAKISKLKWVKKEIGISEIILSDLEVNLFKVEDSLKVNTEVRSVEGKEEQKPIKWDIQAENVKLTNTAFRYFDSTSLTLVDVHVPELAVRLIWY